MFGNDEVLAKDGMDCVCMCLHQKIFLLLHLDKIFKHPIFAQVVTTRKEASLSPQTIFPLSMLFTPICHWSNAIARCS